jgi:hypothetical protein
MSKIRNLLACLLAVTAFAWPSHPAAQTPTEEQVKAAYLHRFLSFIDWPPRAFDAPAAPMVVGVLGADEVHDQLAVLAAGRTVHQRPIVVRRLREGEPLAGVHLLFVGRRARVAPVAKLAPPWTVVVAESSGALDAGASMNFVLVDGRVRFEIATEHAARGDLRFSPRLLAVAQAVRGGAR